MQISFAASLLAMAAFVGSAFAETHTVSFTNK